VAAELIRDNLEDLDIDGDDRGANTAGVIYPDNFELPSPGELKSYDVETVKKTREITARFQSGPYYHMMSDRGNGPDRFVGSSSSSSSSSSSGSSSSISSSSSVGGVSGDSSNLNALSLVESIQSMAPADGSDLVAFVPAELLVEGVKAVRKKTLEKKGTKASDQFDLIVEEMKKDAATGGRMGEKKEDEENMDEMEEEEVEEEEDDDYGVDHYASDDGGDDDDGEAVM